MTEPQPLDERADENTPHETVASLPIYQGHQDAQLLVDGILAARDTPGSHRRRSELVNHAVSEHALDSDLAEYLFDIASEEALEPAYAFELVYSGMAVCEPDSAGMETEETLVEGAPEWVEIPAMPDDEARRERRMRASFRRLRHLLESAEPDAAARAFLEEPDVGPCGY